MRLSIAGFAVAAVAILAACGGSSASTSPTPQTSITATASTAPVPACTSLNLLAHFVAGDGTPGHQSLTFSVTNTLNACTLNGPPDINWYDEAGTVLNIPPSSPGPACADNVSDYTACIDGGTMVLPGMGDDLPAAAITGAEVVVRVDNDDLSSCAVKAEDAAFIGLDFNGEARDAQVQLPDAVPLLNCRPPVTVVGYGPVSGEVPTPQASAQS